jgi:streptogramin lyase
MPLRTVVFTVLLALLLAASAAAAPAVTGEFPVEGLKEANNKIVEGPDGNMWVTVAAGGKDVARITPTGEVKEFEVAAVAAPSGIAKGPEGKLWITFDGGVASFSPSSPETGTETAIPAIKDGSSIVAGPDGNMWVATPALVDGQVIRFSPAAPALAVPVPVTPKLVPHDIDAIGSLIVIASAGENPRIVTLTTAGVEKDYPIAGGSQGVAGNKAGLIAYSQQESPPEQVGLINPPTILPPVNLPGGVGDPFGVALGSDEAFWAVLFAKDGVERLTPTGAISFLGGLKTGSMPRQIAAGPGNTLWVTETKNEAEAVGRISGLEPPVKPPPLVEPQTNLKGPKGTVKTRRRLATVKFRFSSATAGVSFECRLNRLGTKKKHRKAHGSKAAAQFAACTSPKTYRLRPGRYRFEVRAILAGVFDQSPAVSVFKVVHVAPKRHR